MHYMMLGLQLLLLPMMVCAQNNYNARLIVQDRTVRNGPQNEYLPPVILSTSSESTFFGEQSQINAEVFDREKICDYESKSSDCELERKKTESSLVQNNLKLSEFLAPPFTDYDKKNDSLRTKPSVFSAAKEVEIKSKKFDNGFVINSSEPASSTFKNVVSSEKKEASANNLRSYLPPQTEYSAAAQTPQAVVRIPQEESHHHHHHHHHDENFDICSDPFHAFLCAPLKARKRITGALPERLGGQASFNQYQKVLPPVELLNQYLPPQTNDVPKIKPVFINAESSNKFITTAKLNVAPTTSFPLKSPELKAETSNEGDKFYLPPKPDNSKMNLFSEISPRLPQNVENIGQVRTSSNSFLSPKPVELRQFRSKEYNSNFETSATTENQIAVNFLSTTTKTNANQPGFQASTKKSNFQSKDSFPSNPLKSNIRSRVSFSSLNDQAIDLQSTHKSLNLLPNFRPSNLENPALRDSKLFDVESHKRLSSSTANKQHINFEASNAAPFISTSRLAIKEKSLLTPLASNLDYTSQPPSNFVSKTIESFSKTTKYSTFAPQNFDRSTSVPSFLINLNNKQPASHLEPKNRVATSVKPVEINSKEKTKFSQSYPTYTTPRLPPQNGYSHPKNSSLLESQTTSKPLKYEISTASSNEQSTSLGYDYSKPSLPFPEPSEQKNVAIIETTSVAYNYPQPKKKFTLPEQKLASEATGTLTITQIKNENGYHYPKPQESFDTPQQEGYTYPKPEKKFVLPSEEQYKPLFSEEVKPVTDLNDLGSAIFIPVNKLNKRSGLNKLSVKAGSFGERLKKREKKIFN